MRIRTKRPVAPTPLPAAEVTTSGESHAPELKIRAFRIGFVGALGVLLAVLLGSILGQLGTVILYVALALFLALGLDPVVSWLQRREMPRWLAILLVFVVVIGVFVGLIATIVPLIVQQTTKIVEDWDSIVENVQNSDFVAWLNNLSGSGQGIQDAIASAGDWLADPENLGSLGGGILAVGAGIAGGFTGAVIVQVSLAAINGVLSLIYLSIIGAPAPILLAFIAFLFSLVPLVGTLTGAIIITLVCFAASPATALAAGIYYLIYMQVEAYVLSPRIMNRAVAVPGALVVIAAVAGGTLGGVLGALVAIPIAASLIIIVEKVVFPRQDAI